MSRWICFLLAVTVGSAAVHAQRSGEAEALLVRGLHAALEHDYADARASFDGAARSAPEDPAGVVLLAGLLYQSAEDLSVPFDRRAFDSLLTLAEVRATSGRGTPPTDRMMWRATARGMLSVVESRSGQWMAAIRDALASASEARSSLGQVPDVADAGLPMGNYLYWRSRKTEALQWLPFIPDDREEGIRLLERCAREGKFHKWAAISSLIWILHDAQELGRAESWARTGLTAYPRNRTYLAGSAKVLESRAQYGEAANAWRSIAASLRQDPAAGRYALFSAVVNEARCLRMGGDPSAAVKVLLAVVPPAPREVPDWIVQRLAAKTKEYEELRTALAAETDPAATLNGGR
ncbi:MAG: hypothetical protein MUE68_00925 [Bacteroidetes bacterium]|jgi:hypothetical protein|nr:hypothetical protein [Bacteroidota bacterium]